MVHFFIRHSNSVANHSYTLDFPYSITNWPCHTIEARNAIEELVPDYRVIPIPAYEFEGGLMYPQWYKQMLSDALVELHLLTTPSRIRMVEKLTVTYMFLSYIP
jgi:hypothetical protein